MNLPGVFSITIIALVLFAPGLTQAKPDRFYLPQPDQPFEGKVDTRIGTLEFDNQYPSEESKQMLLDNMDFQRYARKLGNKRLR